LNVGGNLFGGNLFEENLVGENLFGRSLIIELGVDSIGLKNPLTAAARTIKVLLVHRASPYIIILLHDACTIIFSISKNLIIAIMLLIAWKSRAYPSRSGCPRKNTCQSFNIQKSA
jgi:hypothetical protein